MKTAELLDRLRRQDPEAAKHLNECFVPSIWRYVFFRVDRDPHLAEDIVAETVLAFVAAVDSQTDIENPAAWLRTVAQRRIQTHFRAAARVQHLVQTVKETKSEIDSQDPAALHDKQLQRQRVREAMQQLPDNYRMTLEWKYVDRLSVKVIAERLGATEKSAESILFRARNALRDRLDSDQPISRRQSSEAGTQQDSTHNEDPIACSEAGESRSAGKPTKRSSNTHRDANERSTVREQSSPFVSPRLAGDS